MINESDLQDYERHAVSGSSNLHRIACALIVEVRRLKHELIDPNYMYASGRVPRQALVSRLEEIDALKQKAKESEKVIKETNDALVEGMAELEKLKIQIAVLKKEVQNGA